MPPSRRRTLYALTAAVAGLAGAGLAWWRYTPAQLDDGVAQQLWGLEFDTPAGTRLAMQGLRGRPLLINFWATWCPPCVEELPLLDAFYRENQSKGWQVVGIAVDKLVPVQSFLVRQPLAFPVVLAGMDGLNLSKNLGNQAGGLPFSVLFGADGSILHRKIGKLSEQDLQLWRELR
ncbi:MAG: TlpA disulfide reductase family protein [Hylemonella sp.]|nr:TlpA disulfide reductase family protein [Hylemonella sp.]MCZ8253580.1 TlpA disulfide reductase family protein [Hylemonella sp.]